MTKVYAVRQAVGTLGDFLVGDDRELVISVMSKLNMYAEHESMLEIPVWHNGKTRRGGMFTYRKLGATFADWRDGRQVPETVVPIKIELHPALYDKAFPERKEDARQTLLHEIAHYLTAAGLRGRGHGREWQRVMHLLAIPADRTHDLPYVTSTRKKVTYECRTCKYEFTVGRKLKNDGAGRHHAGICNRVAPHFGSIIRTSP